ncbi:hypothetical protein Syncc8109_2132 [Synechococcus sp. WH 8109]|nr:hypothetical protein Syncc8109_2132 [Synechococcus sp. WH 8109]
MPLSPFAAAEAGKKKAPVVSPKLEAFSSLFFMMLLGFVKGGLHI